jgi:LuxR family maltose regulon positive regulatory protein
MTATLLDAAPAIDQPQRLLEALGHGLQRRPRPRATVHRPRLLAPLVAPDAPPFVVLVAPAGYGKTTVLCDWSARDPRPFAWVTLDRGHDDPGQLLRSIASAIDEADAVATDGRIVLVLDDVQALTAPAAHEIVAALATQPPEGMTVAFASRAELPVPVARLRAQRLVTELRVPELAMTRAEAGTMLRSAGLALDRADLDALLRRTEGWPVGLALAALSLNDQALSAAALTRFGGGDRLVADYLRQEVLAALSEDDLRFIVSTSILDVLSAPLCDAVLDREGGAETLARLVRSGFPLVALDRTAERYRCHRLLADMLQIEIHRSGAGAEAELHRRASLWHRVAGDGERALQHAIAADEIGSAGDLVWADVPASLEQGSSANLEHCLTRFRDAQLAAHPRLALATAGTHLVYGRGHLAEHWLLAAASATPAPGDEALVRGGVAALTAALGRDGLAQMSAGAAEATALLAPDSPCQPLCRMIAGIAEHLRGDRVRARRELEAGARRAAVPAPQIHAVCLSQLALMALDEHDSEDAARLITRARAQVTRYKLDRYPTSALVLAVSALVRAQRGRVEDAREDLRAAAALLERLTDFAPWYVIEAEIVLAGTALRLSDVNGARDRLEEARRLIPRLPEATVLRGWLQAAEADLAEYSNTVSQMPWSLTAAELRVLQFLPTHLSFREIAEQTCVSANTVKTQANAVYRKLDVRSRSDAVSRARRLGLIDAAPGDPFS